MKKFWGYFLLIVYLLISAVSFAMLLKPGASFFYLREKIDSTQISRDSGFSYRYKPVGKVFEFSHADQLVLLEDGKYLDRSNSNSVVSSGKGKFSAGQTISEKGYIFFSATDDSNPSQNGKSYELIYPNPIFSPPVLVGGLAIFCLGLFYIGKFIPEVAGIIRRKENSLNIFVNKIGDDVWLIYFRLREEKRAYLIGCFIIGAILFTITALRAGTTGITYDEAFSYLYYSGTPDGFMQIAIANNHPLNSFLIYLSCTLTGIYYNELIIRLPILLFYILYIGIAAHFSTLFNRKFLIFTLLCGNYYLSEYFGLARGYGMGASLLLAGLYVYSRNRENQRNIIIAIYLFLLACAGSFMLLVFLGCFVLYVIIFDIKFVNLSGFLKKNWLHLILQTIGAGLMAYTFLQVTRDGLPLFGGHGSFFNDILSGYVNMFTDNPLAVQVASYGIIVFYLLALFLLRTKIFKKPYTVLLASSLGMIVISATIFKRPLPAARILLPMWPLVALSIGEIYDTVLISAEKSYWHYVPNALGLGISFLLMVNFFFSVNLLSTTDFKANYPVRASIYEDSIRFGKAKPGRTYPIARFYIEKINTELGINVSSTK